jgi:preprotein translocase subunit SecG
MPLPIGVGGYKMDVIKYILIALEVLASLALILVVLFQSGKESGLSGALAGKSDSYLAKNKAGNLDQMLASSTKWIAAAWVVLTLLLSLV